ncbi:GCN5-related N-acetyltransferase [Sulfuricurvum kujiense DSM 16994]|uniref:GCN5-related N-acetyltransferase n=1 Tax=Sulfuricurvum kujiense (strain ATCC BAA-921 / DSM 16994 / JCM 11577 / YK-1) TaxID=709032 RepID=E4TZQ7_SULKY|nr:GNAT family N-acetyltransferase [Sulfuricurvum kujiense]ADR34164.1 GCN5-related N-acetyltransferase [Sulfuricurvum kujiense DSM 16994]
MIVRRANYKDIPEMSSLLSELFAIEDDFTVDAEKQSRGLKLLLDTPNAVVLVAEEDECVIGMVSMQSLVSTAIGENVGLIEDMIVTQAHRGKRIGSSLLEALIAESAKKNYGRLSLGADNRNSGAIAFYQKYGFTTSHMGLMYRVNG